jgi:hypothetical protein
LPVVFFVFNFEKAKNILTKPKFMNAKKIYTVILILSTSLFCRAQIVKGDKLLGGSIGFLKGDVRNNIGTVNSITSVNFGIAYGKAVKNNMVNGFTSSFGFTNQPVTTYDPVIGNYTTRSENFAASAGVFKRRYLPLGKNFYVFGELSGTLRYGQNNFDYLASPGVFKKEVTKYYGINASLNPGLSYQVSNRFMLDLTLGALVTAGYDHNTNEINSPPSRPNVNLFYLNSNLSLTNLGNISVGFRVLFHGKKDSAKAKS